MFTLGLCFGHFSTRTSFNKGDILNIFKSFIAAGWPNIKCQIIADHRTQVKVAALLACNCQFFGTIHLQNCDAASIWNSPSIQMLLGTWILHVVLRSCWCPLKWIFLNTLLQTVPRSFANNAFATCRVEFLICKCTLMWLHQLIQGTVDVVLHEGLMRYCTFYSARIFSFMKKTIYLQYASFHYFIHKPWHSKLTF